MFETQTDLIAPSDNQLSDNQLRQVLASLSIFGLTSLSSFWCGSVLRDLMSAMNSLILHPNSWSGLAANARMYLRIFLRGFRGNLTAKIHRQFSYTWFQIRYLSQRYSDQHTFLCPSWFPLGARALGSGTGRARHLRRLTVGRDTVR